MTIEKIPNEDLQYYLISYDKKGREWTDDPDAPNGLMSEGVKQDLQEQPFTDVFIISHGWNGDVPAAKEQCNDWIGAMLQCKEDRKKVRQVRPGFRPLLIGLHWPSLPWGDEDLGSSPMSFDPTADPIAPLVEGAVDKIADSEAAREALEIIFTAADDDIAPSSLSPEVVEAYKILHKEAGLAADGPAGAPGADIENFDPERVYQEASEIGDDTVSFGGSGAGGILNVLGQLSFWKMKKRAREFGESGAADLLRALQGLAEDTVQFHLMGHSFGSIVVSAAVAGADGDSPLIRPVHSLFLVQGALSLWAYCLDIPVAQGKAGYFHSIISKDKVVGPIVTTLSEHDTANRVLYPLGTRISGGISFVPGELPKYGALGCFGIQGVDGNDMVDMLPEDGTYGFQGGEIYNLESSNIIRKGGGASGAHSDISYPEVAHAFWEAVMVQTDEVSEGIVSFNGINGATGGYLTPEMTAADVSGIAQGEKLDEKYRNHLDELKLLKNYEALGKKFAPEEGVDPKRIDQTGWGIIFAFADKDKVAAWKEALKPLLDWRKKQAGALYREFIGLDAYRPGESKNDFLGRHKTGPGPVDPTKVPYYLLIVADPETIPYSFQYQSDAQFAVGRIYFGDNFEEYAHYANSVVRSEKGEFPRSSKATFFGVQNLADEATEFSATELVQPLAEWMTKDKPEWSVQTLLKEETTKANLTDLFNSPEGPALLFSASHGMGFPNGDPRQLPHQGALLCQDWPGPSQWRRGTPIPEKHYFSADDVGADACLGGMINFHFACYGAGTPQKDDFAHRAYQERKDIAPHAFMARLPQRLLCHPKGGTLAVIGHVERAWASSFLWGRAGAQRTVFESTLKRLLEGHPVGSAVEYLNRRYTELSSDLNVLLEEIKYGKEANDLKLAGMWTANNDARGYAIIGDPAVRLPPSATGVEIPKTPIRGQPDDVSSETNSDYLDHTVTVAISNKTGEVLDTKSWNGSLIIPSDLDEDEKNECLAKLNQKIVEEAKKVWKEDSSVIPMDKKDEE